MASVSIDTVLSIVVLVFSPIHHGFCSPHENRQTVHPMVGEFPSWQFAAISAYEKHGSRLAQIESASGLKPILVSTGDGWQIGHLLEQLENDWVSVFLPQSPTPMSGNMMYLPAERVRPLAITIVHAISIVKAMGVGSGALLRGVDLSLQSTDS